MESEVSNGAYDVDPSADLALLERLVRARHSCRAFKPDPIPHNLVKCILDGAQRTASDCNVQPWLVTVVSGAALERLRTAMFERATSGAAPIADIPTIGAYTGVYQSRRRDCGWALYGSLGIQKGDRVASNKQAMENFRFFGAPHLALVTTHASLGARGLLDCGGYVTTFMLLAQALGIATVPQASIASRADVLHEQLALPEDQHVVCGIAFGRADADHASNGFRTSRAPLSETARFLDD